jgi:hypothetical protein
MNTQKATATVTVCLLAFPIVGCAAKPPKAEVERRVKENLAKASPEWKDVTYDTRANDLVSAVGASRALNGKPYFFSFTGSEGNGGVAVRSPAGEWLCKYLYEKGNEVESQRMTGTDADVSTFRATAAEFATACTAACP